MSSNIKESRKEIISKLQLIQDYALRRITSVYKTVFIKTLQIKINIFLINVYFEKLVQRLIVIINTQKLDKTINTTIQYIRNNFIFKKEQKLKLKTIFL